MNKTKVIMVAVLCLLVGVVGGVIVDRIFYGYKLAQHFNNDQNDSLSQNDDVSTDEISNVPEFDTEFNYDNFYEALTTASVKNQMLISDVTTNDDITLIHSKSYKDFGKDQIEYENKTINFNINGMSYNEIDAIKVEDNPIDATIKIFKMNKYFIFFEGDSSSVYKNIIFYDENMNKITNSTYSIYEPVISDNEVYFETLGDPMKCLNESYGYKFDSKTGEAVKVFTINRTKQLVC